MGPLTREIQKVQNDLVKLARKLDSLQSKVQEAELHWQIFKAEEDRLKRVGAEDWHESGIRIKNGRVLKMKASHS